MAEPALAQDSSGLLLRQDANSDPVRFLTPEEQSELDDPFFNLVLKEHADATSLSEVEDLIQPSPSQRHTFVVEEKIADPALGQGRRAVLTYSGSNGSELLNTDVMLSVFFTSEQFPDRQPIEALGWDDERGRYNYYKLDRQGTGSPSWKFRGSSENADALTASQRSGTCMQCHINGAPVMKELLRPWNNWHSLDFPVTYLQGFQTEDAPPWRVSQDSKLRGGRLGGAETLERLIISPIRKFNRAKIAKLIRHDDGGQPIADASGFQEVTNGKALLKPLFTTTEYNIISADRILSGLHPFPEVNTDGPTQPVQIPNSFFLNANLVGGSRILNYKGLGVSEAQTFSSTAELSPEEYKNLIVGSQTKLGDIAPGDAVFAWLVPEPSHIDNDLVDRLMRQGIVTPEFVAAVAAIDLENPVLSKDREALLDLIPDSFRFKPLEGADPLKAKRHPDELTQTVIDTLKRLKPPSQSPAGELLTILQTDNPKRVLADRVKAYRTTLEAKLDRRDAASRQAELERLYAVAIARRQAVLRDATLSALNESGDMLFPMP
ncbi:MAG: hypothetical protein ACFB5Z_21075 [Elainellaceae cyanobacterium]